MSTQPIDENSNEFTIRVSPGETPDNLPDGFDIVGIEGDDDWDYFILRRINA